VRRVLAREDVPVDQADDVGEGGGVDADLGGLGFPQHAHRRGVDGLVLGGAGLEGGELRGARRPEPDLVEVFPDLAAPVREVIQDGLVDADQVGDPVVDLAPLHAEAVGELVSEVGSVEEAAGLGVLVHQPAVEGASVAVIAGGHVGDQHVGVEMRIAGSARAVPELGGDEALDLNLGETVLADARAGCGVLHVAERGVDRGVVRGANLRRDVVAAKCEQDGHGLGCSKAQVVAGNGAASERGKHLASARVAPLPDRAQIFAGDLAVEVGEEHPGGGDGPLPGGFAHATVVSVDAARDGLDVIAVGADVALADAQHVIDPSISEGETRAARVRGRSSRSR